MREREKEKESEKVSKMGKFLKFFNKVEKEVILYYSFKPLNKAC
jgi:hypothetical protein